MKVFAGTSGYSYAEWKGPFYPGDLPPREMLRFYAERLPAVEINNTFYRLPKEGVLASWASQVPDSFRFSIKASRRITHFARLKETADEPTGYLLRTAQALGDRLGVLLFQLPPNLPADLPRLQRFLDTLPGGTRAAFEFRHESWRDDRVADALRARGMALVCVDGDGEESCSPLVATGPYAYLRLRRAGYDAEALASWAQRVQALGVDEAFVFFKHEDDGAGPALAAAFLEACARTAGRRPARRARRSRAAEREAG